MPTAASPTPHPGFRPCVGIVLRNPQRRIFIGARRGPLRNAWQMPQGGIDPGETARAAALRELHEEVGTDRAVIIAESRWWYAYQLPAGLAPRAWAGRFRGQTQKWFAFDFTGDDADFDLAAHAPEFDRWRWATQDEVLALIVDFKRPVYRAVLEEFRPLLEPAALSGRAGA